MNADPNMTRRTVLGAGVAGHGHDGLDQVVDVDEAELEDRRRAVANGNPIESLLRLR